MMHSRNSSQTPNQGIDKLDFDSHRKLIARDGESVCSGQGGLLRDDESLLSNVVEGVVESDRRKLRRAIAKYISFASALLCCLCAGSITTFSLYGPLLQTHLRYTQFQVNAVSITSGLSQYLLVPLAGFLCDRYSPRPLSLASAILFGGGYLLAAVTYRKGLLQEAGSTYRTMVVAFAGIGLGTCCMVMSSITTCAKNFAESKHKGLALSLPIAAYGLSGMWLSQVGSQLLYEPGKGGKKGDVDVYRYFLFLMGLLFVVGIIGALTLQVVNEEELINEGVSELERSGYRDHAFNRPLFLHDGSSGYGTISRSSSTRSSTKSIPDKSSLPSSDAAKKALVLNNETRRFVFDPNMWLLTVGFFLVSGPGESFINNLGTIVGTLYPAASSSVPTSNSAATNISTVAIASTLARLLSGALSDLLGPSPSSLDSPPKFTLSRLVFLLVSVVLLLLGQIFLASGLIQHLPHLFPLVSALFGISYGGAFSLLPVIVSVVWGARNFGTNWGITMVLPAIGAATWSAVYSAVYQAGANAGGRQGNPVEEVLCYGLKCYQSTFASMAVCSLVAFSAWAWAWHNWRRAGIPV